MKKLLNQFAFVIAISLPCVFASSCEEDIVSGEEAITYEDIVLTDVAIKTSTDFKNSSEKTGQTTTVEEKEGPRDGKEEYMMGEPPNYQ